MLHEARQTFIHEEAKKLREKLNIEMNTPESFFIVKEILDRYDNASKLHQPTVSNSVGDAVAKAGVITGIAVSRYGVPPTDS